MLVKIDATTRRGNALSFEVFENDSGFQIAEIEGIEPVKANLVATSFAGMDGEQFQSATRGPRNIKIKLELEPDFVTDTYYSLRQELYKVFMPKATIALRFHLSSGLYLDIDAVVEEITPEFSSVDVPIDISLMCYKPDFVDPRRVVLPGMTVATTETMHIDYPGNVEAGTVITLNVNRTIGDFSISNTNEEGFTSKLDFSYPLIAGDVLVISSLKGNKGISLTRSGVQKSLLYGRSSQSGWIEFIQGINQFKIYALGDPIPYQLEYLVRYGGL